MRRLHPCAWRTRKQKGPVEANEPFAFPSRTAHGCKHRSRGTRELPLVVSVVAQALRRAQRRALKSQASSHPLRCTAPWAPPIHPEGTHSVERGPVHAQGMDPPRRRATRVRTWLPGRSASFVRPQRPLARRCTRGTMYMKKPTGCGTAALGCAPAGRMVLSIERSVKELHSRGRLCHTGLFHRW